MKQVIQNYRTGRLEVAEVPIPVCSPNTVLVKNVASLISIGSESSVLELGRKSLLGKAKTRPDLVERFMDKAKKEGFLKTFQEALSRLDNPTTLGYSSTGVVVEVGANIHKLSPGDKVACIGAGYASHAGHVTVPENLCCKVPDCLAFEEASFGMLGAIALHGVRCARLTLGTSVAVIGLGLLGLLTVQILKAYGCRVIGTDIDLTKLELAKKLGADITTESSKLKAQSELFTNGLGVDAVILTVATKSDEPVNTAVDIARYSARIVIVGVTDIHPPRNEMWHKEVEIIVSKAGGPGTFDPFYENKGLDYVRWTVNRNLEEFFRLMSEEKVDVKPLISHKFKIDQAENVYKNIIDRKGGPYIGVVLEHPDEPQDTEHKRQNISERKIVLKPPSQKASAVSLGIIGAGLFGKAVLLPILKKIPGINFDTIATSSSANTYHVARKYGFEKCTTDYKEIFSNNNINSIIILTPHSLHAKMVIKAINAGKHVFVEKPLCIDEKELNQIMKAYLEIQNSRSSTPLLVVGYNRRFSPHTSRIDEYLSNRQGPMVINYRINPGFLPTDHWVHSEQEGGSRVIGEMCHFVDFMQFLTHSNPIRIFAERVSGNNRTILNSDNVVITLKFCDGSVGNIVYSASGDKAFSREQIEVFCEGSVIVSKDFRQSFFYKEGKCKSFKTTNQQLGYREELCHFFDVIVGNSASKLSLEEIYYSTLAVLGINEALDKGQVVELKGKGVI